MSDAVDTVSVWALGSVSHGSAGGPIARAFPSPNSQFLLAHHSRKLLLREIKFMAKKPAAVAYSSMLVAVSGG
jgi:hypothetical protein